MRRFFAAVAGACIVFAAGDALAQSFFYLQFLTPVADEASLPTCTNGSIEENRSRLVKAPAPGSIYHCPDGGGTWECLAGADCPALGGSGDITAVGDCSTGACFQSAGQRFAFLGPTGASGVASFRAITEADISDLQSYALSSDLATHEGDASAHHAKTTSAAEITSGTLAHEHGGLEADVSAYGGLVRIAAGATSAVTNLAGLNTAIGASLADGAHTVDTDDQDAAAVPYTPATGTDWTDPDPTAADEAFDALAGRLTTEEGKADDDVPESGDFGALALSGDVTSSGLVTTLAADTVGLAELAACPGPGEIVEYGASGVPSCIATPSGGSGGTPGGSDTQVQYNNGGAFGGMAGVTWDDAALELTVRGQTDATTERVAIFSGPDRATPAVGDEASYSLFSDTSGGFGEMGRVTWKTNAASGASQSSRIDFLVNLAGTMTTALRVSAYGLSVPAVGFPAGTSSTPGWNFGAEASGNGSDEGCYWVSNGIVACVGQGGEAFRWQSGILRLPTAGMLNWSTDTGLERDAAGRVGVTDGSTGTGSILYSAEIAAAAARTCADSGNGSPGTLIASVSGVTYLELTGSDADGCSVTLSETGAVEGQRLEAVAISTAGGTMDFADTAGVQEAAATCSLAINGVATWRYNGTAWILVNCQPTN